MIQKAQAFIDKLYNWLEDSPEIKYLQKFSAHVPQEREYHNNVDVLEKELIHFRKLLDALCNSGMNIDQQIRHMQNYALFKSTVLKLSPQELEALCNTELRIAGTFELLNLARETIRLLDHKLTDKKKNKLLHNLSALANQIVERYGRLELMEDAINGRQKK